MCEATCCFACRAVCIGGGHKPAAHSVGVLGFRRKKLHTGRHPVALPANNSSLSVPNSEFERLYMVGAREKSRTSKRGNACKVGLDMTAVVGAMVRVGNAFRIGKVPEEMSGWDVT